MDKFLIVDGHNLLFQMFYGMPSRITNKDGKAIQGTLGFVGALLKIIRMTEPSHLIVLLTANTKMIVQILTHNIRQTAAMICE